MADVPAIGPHSGPHFSHDKTLDNSTKQYNQLTGLKLFAMSCSVVISVDEFAPFGKAGATSLFWLLIAGILWFLPITQETGEMASIDGWGDGGIFTWVKGTLGEKSGWTAMFYQWIHITVRMDTMMYFVIGAFSIAMTVPKADIQNSTGFVYTYGHLLSSIGLPGDLLGKIVGVLLACGIIGELSNWLAGPNQGLFVAARQGYMPKYFAKPNKRGVPMRIVVLQAIVVTITALMITFDSGENADFAFNVSMAATTAQYLMVYLMMIVAYIVLKNKYENLHRTYRMSNSRTFSIVVAVIGFFITLMAFFITFIPAEGTPAHLRSTYVITLIIMVVIVGILPLIMYRYHDKWSKEVAQYLKEEDKTLTQENK